jgi:signal transduction histidine kinase
VAESIRSQERLYTAALVLICLVLAVGVAMLVGITWREVELGQIKADFAANVSHELLTPVALIRSSAEALVTRDNIAQDRMQRYLEIIGRESRRLTDLMNTVLRFSKARHKNQVYHRVSTDLARLLHEFLADYRPRLAEADFRLTEAIPETSVRANLDKDAMHVVFANLVENAVKFSKHKRNLHVALQAQQGQIMVVFEDQGIGIDQKDQPHIFESFYRGEHNLVKKTRGTGIGLTLSRDIVRAHGGRISARSTPGKGSTFTVTIPSAE